MSRLVPSSCHGLLTKAVMLQLILSLVLVVALPQDAEGYTMAYIRYHADNPDTRLSVYYHDGNNFQYFRTEFTNAKEYVVTGVHLIYSTEIQALWKGTIGIDDFSNSIEYPIALPSTDSKEDSTPYYESFNGPRFLITKSMFTASIRPDLIESNTLLMWFETRDISETTHTYWYMDQDGWKPFTGYEMVMSAMVEEIIDLETGVDNAKAGKIDDKDNLDLYRVLLVGNTTYTFNLINPDRSPFAFRLYDVASVIDDPIMEKTGNIPAESFTFTPFKDSYYYLMVEYPNHKAYIDYQVNVVANRPPTARIDGDTLVNVNQAVKLTAENSTDDDGDLLRYSWDFDDSDGIQEDATKTSPTQVYRAPGVYTITLTVSDGKETAMTQWSVRVNAKPVGDWVIEGVELNETTRLNFDQEYAFKATFSDPDNHDMKYEWDFGDGTTSKDPTTRHTFAEAGKYTLEVKVTVKDIADQTVVTKELVFNQLPSAKFEEPKVVPRVGKKIEFEGFGRDTDGLIVEYRWDLDGDGTADATTSDPYTTHKFTKPGEYNLSFMVVDNNGGIGKAYLELEVKKRLVVQEDNTGIIAGGVAAIVIVVVLVVVYLKVVRRPKEKDAGAGGQADAVETPDGGQGTAAQGTGYDQQQLYGQDQQQYGYGQGQGQQPVNGQATGQQGPSLVPPPKPGKPSGGPSLVPPPKPGQRSGPPRMAPPP